MRRVILALQLVCFRTLVVYLFAEIMFGDLHRTGRLFNSVVRGGLRFARRLLTARIIHIILNTSGPVWELDDAASAIIFGSILVLGMVRCLTAR